MNANGALYPQFPIRRNPPPHQSGPIVIVQVGKTRMAFGRQYLESHSLEDLIALFASLSVGVPPTRPLRLRDRYLFLQTRVRVLLPEDNEPLPVHADSWIALMPQMREIHIVDAEGATIRAFMSSALVLIAAYNGHKKDTRGGVSYTCEGVGDHVVGGMDIQESRHDKPGILGKKQNPADDHI
ncbi:uncharacterized protein SCHCODRAFT_02502418 [Schizophyllum commune H4-8]|nr:uncharacterized protein SCHCODRAFT_02502418 [Schizophyllum commune H4-8]KAI5891922.1 hypothetical protein SCHCODRAFT_02502418 [Schizophyllum commune H4-8]